MGDLIQNDHDILVSLDSKLDNVMSSISNINSITQRLEVRVMAIELNNEREKERVSTLTKDVEKLKNNNTAWSTLNSIGIVIGAIIGYKF